MNNLVPFIHCCTTDDNDYDLVEVLQKTWFNSAGGLCVILRKHHCHNDNDEACGSVRKVFKESVAIITIIITNIKYDRHHLGHHHNDHHHWWECYGSSQGRFSQRIRAAVRTASHPDHCIICIRIIPIIIIIIIINSPSSLAECYSYFLTR